MKKIWIVFIFMAGLSADDIVLPSSFRADFIQTITNADAKVIRYEGEVLFSDRRRLKWTYRSPTRKEVCTDGREVLVVDHDLEQVSAYRIDRGFDLSRIIAEAKPYSGDIFVTEYGGKQYTLRLDSKGQLESVAFYDDLDNKVQILFGHMRYRRQPYRVMEMSCDYPADYDMIRG